MDGRRAAWEPGWEASSARRAKVIVRFWGLFWVLSQLGKGDHFVAWVQGLDVLAWVWVWVRMVEEIAL